MRTASRLVLLGLSWAAWIGACGGKTPPPGPGGDPTGGGTPGDTATDPGSEPPPIDAVPAVVVPAKPDRPPELAPPPFTRVGVGQKVSFATTAIDQDLDVTRVEVTKLPASASFDALTQTVTWTPTKADQPKAEFTLLVTQPGRGAPRPTTWSFEVTAKPQPMPVAPRQSALIETVLMIREAKRLEQVNKDWPIDKMLRVTAEMFRPQFSDAKRKALGKLDTRAMFHSFLASLAETHHNERLDPASPKFDRAVFGDPKAWRIVAVRPRIDRAFTELRIVYRAIKAPEPVFAMWRIRPVTEYAPPVPRPPEEKLANNKIFLGMVAKHFLPGGAPSEKFLKDPVAHGKVVAKFVKELMAFDDTKTAPYLRTFPIGIAQEARLGGGSARKADGSYDHGDGWAWSALKPFITPDGSSQRWTNVVIPGFFTHVEPSADGKRWVGSCGPRWTVGKPGHVAGQEVLCRKPLGFIDLPDTSSGKLHGSKVEATHLFVEHKNVFSVATLPLDDGRRDIGEENGMTCAQCHIRNFGMHDYGDPANVDPSKGVPTSRNKQIATLNFQIVPSTHWEEFTLEFLKHQECRGKAMISEFVSPDAAQGLSCPLAK